MLEFKIHSDRDRGAYHCVVRCPSTGGETKTEPIKLDVLVPPRNAQRFTGKKGCEKGGSKGLSSFGGMWDCSLWNLVLAAQDKVALVIGASSYRLYHEQLKASKHDARRISDLLTDLQFKVSEDGHIPTHVA